MPTIPLHNGLPIILDGKIGTDLECCCQPCCECSGDNAGSVCGLQSVVISLNFTKLGACFPDGANVTFSIFEEDDFGSLDSWSKNYNLAGDDGDVTFWASLRCLGGVGPNGTNCWGVELFIGDGGCNYCFSNPIPGSQEDTAGFSYLTDGVTSDGTCCPAGFERTLVLPEFCDGFAGTLEVTFVY